MMLVPHPEYRIAIEDVDISGLVVDVPVAICSFFRDELEAGTPIHSMDDAGRFNMAYKIECTSGDKTYRCFATIYSWQIEIADRLVQWNSDRLFVAVGKYVCAFHLPDLELQWKTEIDMSHCIQLCYDPVRLCLYSNGELDVARLDLDGNIIWRCSGADIFTNGFSVGEDWIEVIDFYNDVYRIDIETGECKMLTGEKKRSRPEVKTQTVNELSDHSPIEKIWAWVRSSFGMNK